jgi:apolipoprotein N-acyltransferase
LALQQHDWTRSLPTALKVTMVQGNIPQQLKWRRDQRDNIFNTYWRETSQHWDSDLIIWPETALPGHSSQIDSTLLPALQAEALAQDSVLLAGLVYHADQAQFYNSVMQFGREQGLYHKRHLVMFGEYYPMRWLMNLLRGLINIPYADLSAGPDAQPLMQVGDYRLGVSICWEDVFSRDILLSLPRANLLVNVSNDAWFGDSTAPHQHVQIAQMRSLESERVMLRATNTGITAFIDHKGRVLAASEQFRSESISAVVQGRSGVTPFYYFARVQWLFALLPPGLLLLGITRKDG